MNTVETAWCVLALALPALKLAGVLELGWLWALAPLWVVPAVVGMAAGLIAFAITLRVIVLGLGAMLGR